MTADLTWRKSTRCEAHSCVEVGWQVSSRCVSEAHCVAVAPQPDAVLMRDTKLGDSSPILSFAPAAWRAFLTGLRAGDIKP